MTETLLNLVRLGIGHQGDALEREVNWEALRSLAAEQGLLAVVLDGLDKQPMSSYAMPKSLKKQWIGEVIQGCEYRYELCRRAIAELSGWYNTHGYKMMVLKGYACSLDWPKPEHRPSGDIDIWLFGRQKEADKELEKDKGIRIENWHHHHTVFYWRDFMVENHFDFINIYHHRSHAAMEKILKGLGMDDTHSIIDYGERVFLPSPNLHSLFLLKHMALHFASGEIKLRQVLDWAFFVEKHTSEIDWIWLYKVLDEYDMREFFNCVNAICIQDLGFDLGIFPAFQIDSTMKTRVLNDILSPEFSDKMPKTFFARIAWKTRRWIANSWKHKLCYKESLWSAFWSGVWNHLLRPSSI